MKKERVKIYIYKWRQREGIDYHYDRKSGETKNAQLRNRRAEK